jgi:hypothetical protein
MKKITLMIFVAMLATAISCKKEEIAKPVASFTTSVDSVYAVYLGPLFARTTAPADAVVCTNNSTNADTYVWHSTLNNTRDTVLNKNNKTFEYLNRYSCVMWSYRDTITLTAIKGTDKSTFSKIIFVDGIRPILCSSIRKSK